MIKKKFVLGVGVTNAHKKEILEYIIKGLEKNTKKYYIVTPNPEILTLASKDIDYKNILNKAEIALADGVGVIMAGKILGKQLLARVTGIDLLDNLCGDIGEKPITVGFLGGSAGIAEKTAERLRKKHPGLKVAFSGSEWPKLPKFPRLPKLLKSPIDILFVAFGAPKQEIWMSENLDKIPARVAIGVGGAFDYIGGKVPRAPRLVQRLGFEWLFRLFVQPWRLTRQLRLLEFALLVLRERFSPSSKP